ncbi:MAG: hypothetical protein WAT91_00760 [Saprospiraceae bacterium]
MKMMLSLQSNVLRFFVLIGSLLFGCTQAYAQYHAECNCFPPLDCANFTVITKHYIPNHPDFGNPVAMDTNCCNVEFWPVIKVSADGAAGTQIELINVKCCNNGPFNVNKKVFLQMQDENNEPVYNAPPDLYGKFKFVDFGNSRTIFNYTHPKVLPDAGNKTRYITVRILQVDTLNSSIAHLYGRMLIEVYRPPVVFVHGLWSDASAFDPMVSAMSNIEEYENYQFFKANYMSGNASSFQYNEWVVRNGINQVMSQCVQNDLSVGKVNIVVHSMGGLLSRQYIQGPTYNIRNDVNRLITCNTPHAGSQMANFLLDTTQYGNYVAPLFGKLGMDCYGGAVDNLRVNSIQIAGIQAGTSAMDVQYHSLITVEPGIGNFADIVDTIMSYYPLIQASPSLLTGCAASFLDEVFNLDDHDLVVAAESQAGGLTGLQTNTVNNQQHTGSVANNEVIYNVENLLNDAYDSGVFANEYPYTSVTYDLDFPCLPFSDQEHVTRSPALLNIISPATGSVVTAGATVAVTFSASMLDSVTLMMRYRLDSIASIANAASAGNVNFTIPVNLIGTQTLLAVGFGIDKKIKVMDSIHLNVVTTATLDSLIVSPEIMYLHESDSMTYRITGVYSDSINRDLTTYPSIAFDFSFNHASQSGQFIRLEDPYSDTLRVNLSSVVSAPVIIQLTGINYLPGCTMVTNTNNSGFGSLRYALDCVTAYDTIRFASALTGDTIFVDNDVLNVYKSVYIINSNPNKVVIQTNSASRVFRVFSDIDVWLENINLISGDPAVSAISNAGHLTLKNVQLSNTFGGTSEMANNESGNLTILGTCTMQ